MAQNTAQKKKNLIQELIEDKVKHPQVGEQYKVKVKTQKGVDLGYCIFNILPEGFQVASSSIPNGLKKPFKSRTVYSAAEFVFRNVIRKEKHKLGLCSNGMGPELYIYKLTIQK